MSYGQVNADVIGTSVANSSLGAGNATLMKNKIINGACVIDQRNAGASVTPTVNATYTLDRWMAELSQASKFSVQQNAGSVTPPAGFTNYLGVTSLSAYSVNAGDYFTIENRIEGFNTADLGWGTSNAKTVTLSFWVRSSLTGTFGGALQNNSFNRSYPFSYTISSANTWTNISITVAGDTTGTWNTTNGIGIDVVFGLGIGSTYGSGTAGVWASSLIFAPSGSVSVVGTNGATWYITGVQLEVGSSATGFEYENYTSLLQKCQRYYAKETSSTGYVGFGSGYLGGSNVANIYTKYPVTMRTAPTIAFSNLILIGGGTSGTVSTLGVYAGSDSALLSPNTSTSPFTAYQGCALTGDSSGTGFLTLSAEL